MHRLLNASVAPSTNKCYRSGWNQWLKHCALSKCESPLEPSEQELMKFVARLSMPRPGKPRGLAVKTVRNYLAAIAHFHGVEGLPDPKEGKVRLAKELTGLKRWRGTETKPKRPITIGLLREMKKHVRLDTLEGTAHWAAMCMGVHGLFRLGELLPPPAEKRALVMDDIAWLSAEHVTVRLRTSKTDPYGKGAHVNLFATGDDTCPVTAMRELQRMQRAAGIAIGKDTPVFAYNTELSVVRKEAMIVVIKRVVAKVAKEYPAMGLESKDFAGHSLRRGGATSLALRGVRESVLRLLGRWVSDAVNLYISLPVDSLKHASRVMVTDPDRFKKADLDAAASVTSVDPWVAGL